MPDPDKMDKPAARERLQNIVKAWENMIASYPPEVAEAKTTMMVLRDPDIQAMKVALEALT